MSVLSLFPVPEVAVGWNGEVRGTAAAELVGAQSRVLHAANE